MKPETILQGGRYRLRTQVWVQPWGEGGEERWWTAQEQQERQKQYRLLCDVVLPELGGSWQQQVQPILSAWLALGAHPHLSAWLEVVVEGQHLFCVFERPAGKPLHTHIQQHGPLGEEEVLRGCWAIAQALHLLASQSPPLSHGLISPSTVLLTPLSPRTPQRHWRLSACSVLARCQRPSQSRIPPPFSPPEMGGFPDLYALLGTAYYALTGYVPAGGAQGLPPARQLNPLLSPSCSDLLAKGLHPVAHERFGHPGELSEALRACLEQFKHASAPIVTSTSRGHLAAPGRVVGERRREEQQRLPQAVMASLLPAPPDSRDQTSGTVVVGPGEETREAPLLPLPGDLAPPPRNKEALVTLCWGMGTLLLAGAIVLLAGRF